MSALTLTSNLDQLVEETPAEGRYRIDRRIFTDQQLFELEMKYIFEGSWIYLAHESQIPNPNDFLTLTMGRQPIILNRDKEGKIGALVNACSHRGATVCRESRGNKSVFTCPFHGWSYNNKGDLLKVKDPNGAGYPESFCKENLGLKRVPLVESYRGFIFGCLSADAPALHEHLGDTRTILDIMVDQAPQGLEVLKGSSTYTYKGNWKLQTENGADGYHVSAVHWNYIATVGRRKTGLSLDKVKAMDVGAWNSQPGGFFAFENGHILLWFEFPNPQDRPLHPRRAEIEAQYGKTYADWMIDRGRNMGLYPNVFVMDQMSTQLRVIRPLAANKTEVTIFCIAPVGEAPQARNHRIRQYEDFFNASGMATPDDLTEFEECQVGYNGESSRWNDLSRGAAHWVKGADQHAAALGIKPIMSGIKPEDEGLFLVQHQHWLHKMREGALREAGDTV